MTARHIRRQSRSRSKYLALLLNALASDSERLELKLGLLSGNDSIGDHRSQKLANAVCYLSVTLINDHAFH